MQATVWLSAMVAIVQCNVHVMLTVTMTVLISGLSTWQSEGNELHFLELEVVARNGPNAPELRAMSL